MVNILLLRTTKGDCYLFYRHSSAYGTRKFETSLDWQRVQCSFYHFAKTELPATCLPQN